MFNKNLSYFTIIGFHIALAIVVFAVPFLSKVYGLLIFFFGIIYINNTQNKNHEALVVCGYVVGSEVFLRATGGALLYEYTKYGVILVLFVGMLYQGIAKNAFLYWMYLFLLIPSTLLALFVLDINSEDRKVISNNISGPVCLGICALYCYRRKVSYATMQNIVIAMGLPIVSLVTYLIVFNPSVKEVVTGTDSSFATSGGFGPNQVSTALGLGIFIFVFRVLLDSKSKLLVLVNLALAVIISYRGVVTFSRGGVFTGIAMVCILMLHLYYISNLKTKAKLSVYIIILAFGASAIWGYSSLQTNGLINKRYNNQDSTGKEKESKLSGREEVIENEYTLFIENPILGVGVGRSAQIRKEELGLTVASHNEIGRLLAEHGMLGVMILMILILTPIYLFFKNTKNFFILPFLVFWGLTINHAAMRTAAPAFVYALALINVNFRPQIKPQRQNSPQQIGEN